MLLRMLTIAHAIIYQAVFIPLPPPFKRKRPGDEAKSLPTLELAHGVQFCSDDIHDQIDACM